jgi:hypothetical protein
MLIEGKLVQSAVEILAKKLVDIFGTRADQFFKKDAVRAASYKSYYALRRMEEILKIVETDIKFASVPGRSLDGMHPLGHSLNLLSDQLKTLKDSFSSMKVKMEIYHSIKEATAIDIFIDRDDDLIRKLFDYKYSIYEKNDKTAVLRDMGKGVRSARKSIAKFIKDNYKIEEKDSGR